MSDAPNPLPLNPLPPAAEAQSSTQVSRLLVTILHATGEGIFGLDAAGRITFINRAASELTGWTLTELVGKPFHPLLHPTRPDGFPCPEAGCALLLTARDGQPRSIAEDAFLLKDGARLAVSYTTTPIRTELGRLGGVVIVFRPLTAGAAVEKPAATPAISPVSVAPAVSAAPIAADPTAAMFRLGIERSEEAVFITGPDGAIRYVNPAFEKIYGYTQAEALGQTPRLLKSGVQPPEVYQQFWSTLLTGQTVNGELINRTKDGRLLNIEGSVNPIVGEDGGLIGFLAVQRDITARKRTELDLRRFQLGLEQSADAIFMTDPDGKILYVNPGFEKIYGYTRAEALGQTPRLLKSGVQPAEAYQQFWATLLAKQTVNGELINKAKDGRLVTVEVSVNPILGDDSRLLGFLAVQRDVTDRKRTELDLRRFQLGIEQSVDAVFITDPDGKILYVNPGFEKTYGYTRAEALGQTPRLLKSGVQPPEVYQQFWGALLSKQVVNGELINKTKDGRLLNVEGSVNPILGDDGRLIGYLAVQRDITERKLTELNLRRFQLGLEQSADAIFMTDADGKILYVNPGFEKTYGYTRAEALGQTPRILKSGVMPPEAYQQFWGTLISKQAVTGELINKTKDGRLLNVEGSVNPILGDDGRLLGFLAVQRDITDRKRTEQNLRDSEARFRRQATRLEIATNVSRAAISILDPDELLPRVTDLIREQFGYYHAGVFIMDEAGEWAVLRASTGEAGRQMLERNHRLRVGQQGMVGYVTSAGQPRVAQDVTADPAHRFNPLLPATRGEAVVPMRLGERLLGALDVQSTEANAFQEEDVAVLQSIADQLAVALDNARLFQQTQRSLRELDTLYRRYAQQTRQQTLVAAARDTEFFFNAGLEMDAAPEQHPAVARALNEKHAVVEAGSAAGESVLAVPLLLRDEVIGVLTLDTENAEHPWTADDLTLAEAAAGQIAQSLEVGLLFDRTSSQAQRERLVGEITSEIRAAGNVDDMLRTAVTRLRQALGVRHGAVRLALPPAEVEPGER